MDQVSKNLLELEHDSKTFVGIFVDYLSQICI